LRPFSELLDITGRYGSMTRYFSLIVILIYILLLLIKKYTLYIPKELIYILFFIILLFMSVFDKISMMNFLGRVFPVIFYLIILNITIKTKINYKFILHSYIFGVLTLSLLSMIFPADGYGTRLTLSSDFSPIYLAYFSSLSIGGLFILIKKETRILKKGIYYLCLIIILLALLLTQTLNVFISIFIAFSIFIFLENKNKVKKILEKKKILIRYNKIIYSLIFILFLIIIIFLLLYFNIDVLLFNKLGRISNLIYNEWGNIDRVTSGRTIIWENAYKMIGEFNVYNWIIGYGVDMFAKQYQLIYGSLKPPHNSYILIFFELGIVGLLLFLLFLVSLFYRIIKKNRNIALFILIYLILAMFGNDIIYYHHFWIGWLFINFDLTYY
jgi:O-antigen ligase